jgi:Asp-tRNA(Asn)/Glu-tRNA(Gln) amidotransferase A subunit family amidase
MGSGNIGNLDITSLRSAYLSGKYEAVTFIRELLRKIRKGDTHNAWIYVLNEAEIKPYLERLHQSSIEELPLYGIPFAVKDNIDIHGVPTTVACPEISYPPRASATVVEKLIAAGAVPINSPPAWWGHVLLMAFVVILSIRNTSPAVPARVPRWRSRWGR